MPTYRLKELITYRENMLAHYRSLPEALAKAYANVPEDLRFSVIESVGRTPHQILALVKDAETLVFAPHLREILTEKTPRFELFEDEAWLAEKYNSDETAENILEAYKRLRSEELDWLEHMPTEGWNRKAWHPWFGERTLEWWVEKGLAFANEQMHKILDLSKTSQE